VRLAITSSNLLVPAEGIEPPTFGLQNQWFRFYDCDFSNGCTVNLWLRCEFFPFEPIIIERCHLRVIDDAHHLSPICINNCKSVSELAMRFARVPTASCKLSMLKNA
jgi:hypothetical protein